MTYVIWRIATDTPDYAADDMTGSGAKKTGGRWNRSGTPVLYCADNISLACLETFVHIQSGGLPLNRYLIQISVPDDIWEDARRYKKHPPVGWDAIPTAKVSLDEGQKWLSGSKTALLLVPSVIVREEVVVLINPDHPDASRIKAKKIRKWEYDLRLVK
jgi:RES domain-containing protein